MLLWTVILFTILSTTTSNPLCQYVGHDLTPFQNITLTSYGLTGGKYDISLCGPLKNKCVDSLTHNKIPGKVFSYFGEKPFFHCWDVLVLPDVVPQPVKLPNGLELIFTRQGDAHLSCETVEVVVTIVCDPHASAIPSQANVTGVQDSCTWRIGVKSSHPSICTTAKQKNSIQMNDPTLVTTIENGPLRGILSSTGQTRSFLGIPYAKPPLHQHRWKPPRPLPPFPKSTLHLSPRDATKFASSCWQQGGIFGASKQSEDCLYLNVYAPSKINPTKKYPVLFWIHGGCYVEGTPNIFNGTALVEKFQDVIIVAVTYRLNAFGFLGSNRLRKKHRKTESTGNWGIQDQRLGMKWVQSNIEAFGGDPSRVMIFGQSAGAGSVATHLVAKKSFGLFSRAVMESGSYSNWIAMDLKGSEKNWQALVVLANCTSKQNHKVVQCMRALPAKSLATLTGQLNVPCRDGCTFAPVVDGVELKKYPWELIVEKNGRAPNVPIMHGTNLDDGLLFVNMSRQGTTNDLNFWIHKMYGTRNVEKLKKLYPVQKYNINGSSLTPSFWAADRIETDFAYFCGAHRTSFAFERGGGFPKNGDGLKDVDSISDNRKKHGVPVYQYRFATKAKTYSTVLHGDELPFVWLQNSHKSVKEQPYVADVMSTMWTNFARTGDPNKGIELPANTPRFPKYSGNQIYQFQEKMAVVKNVDRRRCGLMDKEWKREFGRCLPCTIEDKNCN